ncbi:hypothetical protein Tsubulata_031308 [Turnera subulata]|uniref:PLAT domain-containing protein n=1 Tax=Turnera subulata TaxID=218843 RepID=A0A9Q0GHA3_9ROSI|nr:hypothetical protein Tsubulata_031308 [Turnera subulata]
MEPKTVLLASLLFFCFSASVSAEKCVYSLQVKTGTMLWAGTDSKISLNLMTETGEVVSVDNLESWGIMGDDYDYFEQGKLDIFSGIDKCLSGPVCKMNVTSDGEGLHPGWYLCYIDVTTIKPGAKCSHQKFVVDQWLDAEAPNQLWAAKNYCPALNDEALDEDDAVVAETRPAAM